MTIIYLLITLLSVLPFHSSENDSRGDLTIQVSNISTNQGEISIALYNDPDTFCQESGFVTANSFSIDKDGTAYLTFPDLPYGKYALAMYHDINGNGEMDYSVIGIPKEPYAFSNQVRAKWKEPSYESAEFTFDAQLNSHAIEVRFWSEQ